MELCNLFHFNIEVRLPSSMVIGSLPYYPSGCSFLLHGS
jgi:hypothetical protein